MNNLVLKQMKVIMDSEGNPEDVLFKCHETTDSGYVNREYWLSEVIPFNVSISEILSTIFYTYDFEKDEYTVDFEF